MNLLSNIAIRNLTLKFRIYHDHSPSLKAAFADLFTGKRANKYSDFYALNDISLLISSGERVGIIGHNGAGKSTLLKAICGVYDDPAGSVKVNGRIVPLLELGAGFHPEFTGKENIYFNGAILGHPRKELLAKEDEIIDFAEVREFIDTPVKYYSTGMYMRLAFSLATAMHPDILILDEIFAGGDASFLAKAKSRMLSIIDRANIMLMVSHDLELIKTLCNRAIMVERGHIIADGSAASVVAMYQESVANGQSS
jgi:ABC-type polysaccharide/polyol phosphate transport system ATPase subunit